LSSDQSGDLERVVAQPTSEVENLFAAGQLQPGENNGLTGDDVRVLVGLIEEK
jgi:hypothetical protein